MKKLTILAALAATAGLSGMVLMAAQDPADQAAPSEDAPTPVGVQPIAFRHDVHVTDYQIDCQYCHFSAERSVDAGIPSVQDCMGCHAIPMPAEGNPTEIQKIRDHFNEGRPIEWVRVYKISDHAHFPHMRHINAGLECQECHGAVEEMGAIEERDPLWGGDNMGWCISCHLEDTDGDGEPNAARDCTVCHY